MNTTFGFIGTGNMGGALAQAAAKAMDSANILLADRLADKAAQLAEKLGCKSTDAASLAKTCDYIFLGVKPQMMGAKLAEIAPVLAARTDRFVLVSMAAGVAIADIRKMAGVLCR